MYQNFLTLVIVVYIDGSSYTVDGTSASAPVFAGEVKNEHVAY